MSQDRMAKTVIESGRSNSWRFTTHMGDCSRRSLERNHLHHVKNSGDFENVHKEEYDGSRFKVWSRREKFTDKLGALRRWVLSCEDMHIDDFWHAVKEKFSTAGGYTSIDHVKQHVRDYIHTGSERFRPSQPSMYEILVMDENGFLRRNKRSPAINNKAHTSSRSRWRHTNKVSSFDVTAWIKFSKGRMVDVEGAVWYWHDRKTCTRLKRLSADEYAEFKKIHGEGYLYSVKPEQIKFLVDNPVSPTAKSLFDLRKALGFLIKNDALIKFKLSKKPV